MGGAPTLAGAYRGCLLTMGPLLGTDLQACDGCIDDALYAACASVAWALGRGRRLDIIRTPFSEGGPDPFDAWCPLEQAAWVTNAALCALRMGRSFVCITPGRTCDEDLARFIVLGALRALLDPGDADRIDEEVAADIAGKVEAAARADEGVWHSMVRASGGAVGES